ncbi:unnamed protein product [Kluyveromyces dobzhanskii CBS 2104]|uniref:WGS project CCBQ000000000 data, contig 00051 n=1 Tax=Kluyveromyces dobzhanskii CBS 2104 TaxID=1427455 RepID=A0A0A8L7L0_9SACH|nr:unnamed protein product [Kluyveromyces dobzhanskii CBS 2104]
MSGFNSNSNLNTIQDSCSFWNYDDVTECGRVQYINYYLPVTLLSISLLYLFKNAVQHYCRKPETIKPSVESELLGSNFADLPNETKPLLSDNGQTLYTNPDSNKATSTLKEDHFSIDKLTLMDIHPNKHDAVKIVRRNWIEKSRLFLEWIICALQLCIHISVWLKYTDNREDFPTHASLAGLVLWSLLFSVVSLRLANVNQNISWINSGPGNIWALSFVCYLLLFCGSVLPLRSICIGHITDQVPANFYKLQFFLDLALFLLLFTSQAGNRFAIIYKSTLDITPSPEPVTSIASYISYAWVDKFLWDAHQNYIEMKDVWGLMVEDYSILVIKRFNHFVQKKTTKRTFSFNLIHFFLKYIAIQGVWATFSSIISFIPTMLLRRILEYVEDQSTAPSNLAWTYIFVMFLSRILTAVCAAQALFLGRRVCIRMKAIIISEIYSKALKRKISPNSTKEPTNVVDPQQLNDKQQIDGDEESTTSANLGAIINLMAVDAFKVSEICAYLHSFVEAIIMTIVALILLYQLLGWSALVGSLLIVCFLPLNFKLASLLGTLQKKSLAITDKRIQKLNEAFQAIRIIKFFSWEENFEKDIQSTRDDELNMLLKRSVVWAISSLVWFVTPSIVTSASFAVYVYIQGETLTTPVAFTALSLFALLRNPLDMLSDMLSFVIQSKVSLERVQEFLNEEETKKYEQLTISRNKLGFQNATFVWDKNTQDFKLKDLTIDFKIGKLNVIVGPTGSGKTSLLMGLLGEMELLNGKVVMPSLDPREELVVEADGMTNSIAYCSQAAWLLNETVRNNILFNSPYNENRYNAVISACGLKRDFEILSGGDQTEIGEKGITLSGGQKQRVSLARALYSSSRHLLLDDCLSAVDSHTALWIYENCISGPLMEGRTCVLVSHNVALTLKNADWVIILENGKVKEQGEPVDLLQKGSLGDDTMVKTSILSRAVSSVNISEANNKVSSDPSDANTKASRVNDDSTNTESQSKLEGKLISEETKSNGVVSLDVYKWYSVFFGGWKMISFLCFLFLFAQIIGVTQAWWLRAWASNNAVQVISNIGLHISTAFGLSLSGKEAPPPTFSAAMSNNTSISSDFKPSHSNAYYLSIYLGIGVFQALCSSSKAIINFVAGIRASRKIFNLLLKNVLYAKLRFFDSTPIGRIMNRFSKDIESVDQELTPYMEGAFGSLIQCISTIVVIAYITPQFLLVAAIVMLLYYFVAYFYMAGSRELKRLESISRSPIHQHFSETLVGITTIRAFSDERRFLVDNMKKIDENNRPFFYLWVFNRWLSFRIELIGALIVLAAGSFILLNLKSIDSGLAGISLGFAISFTDGALWVVRLYSNVEMNMNSVERLKEYTDIEQEPSNIGGLVPPPMWPQDGKIEVKDLSLRYAANLPKVIKNVTFVVEPKCKVGIVGRTGAGKSTIITALFRFIDPETGFIKIDDIDITTIGLKRLRQSITIIPQDPTLFTGTLKSNLDPYSEYSEAEIFEALKRVNLVSLEELDPSAASDSASVSSENLNKFLDLNNEVSEGGSNLSQGQRQLVCLARSLLRSPKIILLDEATASIDYNSDAKIQATIREEFSNSTILTIAHRLRSIIDYDKILVMDAGEVKEYDHPYSLLLNRDSIFYHMCEDSGELEVLIQLAKESFVKKLNSN